VIRSTSVAALPDGSVSRAVGLVSCLRLRISNRRNHEALSISFGFGFSVGKRLKLVVTHIGEVHDLYVLRRTSRKTPLFRNVFPDAHIPHISDAEKPVPSDSSASASAGVPADLPDGITVEDAEEVAQLADVGMLRRMCDNGEEALHFLKNSFGHVRTRGRQRQRENWTKHEPGS
jgi:hypothetical protein